ncbi:MAG: ATP-dependent RecD-like DNA helicase [Clostridia bacterium]|nr:ATP-dependent RecD-like DNA helicase [Clostridia bacterium]
MEKITLEGVVQDIIYYNEDNGYVIATLQTELELVSIKGTLPFVREGDHIRMVGQMEIHNFYGEQVNILSAEHLKPADREDIFKYLSSGVITGIGPATAELMLNAFGTETLNIIEKAPERLLEVAGIGPKKLEQIIESYKEQYELRDFIIYFQSLNLSVNMAMRIYKKYGIEAIARVEKNPYILAEDVTGVGFKLADQIAMKMGIDFHSPFRIDSGLLHLLNIEASSGHTYAEQEDLVRKVALTLSVEYDEVENQIREMAVTGALKVERVGDGDLRIYLPSLHYSEQQVAAKIYEIGIHALPLKPFYGDQFIKEFELNRGIILGENQKLAIVEALEYGMYIITGGPGTGKTTIINAVIEAYEMFDKKVVLCAPTGRAAKRMTEATKRESKTIHRLLEFQGENQFGKNAEEPLKVDVIIIDEISMVDIVLMYRLLDAIALGTHVIFVGDSDQLPSVGPGSVLKDLLQSDLISSIALDEIYRQSESSLIAVNAHKINHGELPILNKPDKDFFFISSSRSDVILSEIRNLVSQRLPNYYDLDPLEDIQILSPMKNSSVGVNALNDMLQEVINPPEKKKVEKKFGNKTFREGDKVMQIRNNYNLEWISKYGEEGTGVFNGDIGIISEIDAAARSVTVIFDQEREVVYDFPSVDELVLAYAVTVHKSQGSEFKAVIMPMVFGPPMLMSRNILYTAITRAKTLVVLVGDKKAMQEMIRRNQEQHRQSGLRERLEFYRKMASGDLT